MQKKKIISNTKQNDTTVKEFTEISSVVASKNSTATVSFTNALNGKSEAEVNAIIKNFNILRQLTIQKRGYVQVLLHI